jgi:MED6 mediator sub complex component
MADFNGTPLDEIQWRDPGAVQFYGGIQADNLHLYFMHSPFCDPQSNNKNTEVQARYNPELYAVLKDRKRFEDSLRDTMGLKYLIEDGPTENAPNTNPVWLIRGRNKVREHGQEVSKIEGSYFAIGENIYQAPSVKDVLTCRLVSQFCSTSRSSSNDSIDINNAIPPKVQRNSRRNAILHPFPRLVLLPTFQHHSPKRSHQPRINTRLRLLATSKPISSASAKTTNIHAIRALTP